MVSIVYCLGTVIFHVVLLEFGDEHVNEGCLTWEREGKGRDIPHKFSVTLNT